jgi:hypothetical protein
MFLCNKTKISKYKQRHKNIKCGTMWHGAKKPSWPLDFLTGKIYYKDNGGGSNGA